MFDDPSSPLSFVAGSAILTNACAIMQNGATVRYNLAITQWRDFRASLVARDERLSQQYIDTQAALGFAETRVRLQLHGLGLLNAAVALFAATTVMGVSGAFLVQALILSAMPVNVVMLVASGIALFLLLAATITFFREGAYGRALLVLHRDLGEPVAEEIARSTGHAD
ncbi:hypothetical protein [Rhizobium cremeum]|uniref:hypothetical protein n=1 Tax=Rhizobium cremeum TaxID=2813827 RepID=UPI000DE5407A